MMEIVIKIDEWKYKSICEGVEASKRGGVVGVAPTIYEAIYNGTPLPKGHGRLIDADALYEMSRLCHTEEDGTACVEWREINDAPTIIEGSESE